MGGRYLVTGTQLGTLITLSKTDADKCNKELNKIIEQQFIGNSKAELEDDLIFLRKIFSRSS